MSTSNSVGDIKTNFASATGNNSTESDFSGIFQPVSNSNALSDFENSPGFHDPLDLSDDDIVSPQNPSDSTVEVIKEVQGQLSNQDDNTLPMTINKFSQSSVPSYIKKTTEPISMVDEYSHHEELSSIVAESPAHFSQFNSVEPFFHINKMVASTQSDNGFLLIEDSQYDQEIQKLVSPSKLSNRTFFDHKISNTDKNLIKYHKNENSNNDNNNNKSDSDEDEHHNKKDNNKLRIFPVSNESNQTKTVSQNINNNKDKIDNGVKDGVGNPSTNKKVDEDNDNQVPNQVPNPHVNKEDDSTKKNKKKISKKEAKEESETSNKWLSKPSVSPSKSKQRKEKDKEKESPKIKKSKKRKFREVDGDDDGVDTKKSSVKEKKKNKTNESENVNEVDEDEVFESPKPKKRKITPSENEGNPSSNTSTTLKKTRKDSFASYDPSMGTMTLDGEYIEDISISSLPQKVRSPRKVTESHQRILIHNTRSAQSPKKVVNQLSSQSFEERIMEVESQKQKEFLAKKSTNSTSTPPKKTRPESRLKNLKLNTPLVQGDMVEHYKKPKNSSTSTIGSPNTRLNSIFKGMFFIVTGFSADLVGGVELDPPLLDLNKEIQHAITSMGGTITNTIQKKSNKPVFSGFYDVHSSIHSFIHPFIRPSIIYLTLLGSIFDSVISFPNLSPN
eukprot:TRINITY_DN4738_c0_g1_i2.p1 TRINITY_DN4738_c0_g1~~TRINITY_DN4738_c0_g1_i2.p1  ORF type:complete len:672 (+),score=160.27 TRINITY_DN4738_c0_g1_i2:57-2072(+)